MSTRRLDRGNASPEVLVHDFGLFGMRLWAELGRYYPNRVSQWQQRLARLNEARNGLAHDDEGKITKAASSGWPLTLHSVRRWRSTLDGLTAGMDRVVGDHIDQLFGTRAW